MAQYLARLKAKLIAGKGRSRLGAKRLLLVAAVGGLLLSGTTAVTSSAATTTDGDAVDLDVLHLNIFGHVGNADSEEEVTSLVNNLATLIREQQPDLVSLNEVCKSQSDGLANLLAGEYRIFASLDWWPAVQKPACGGAFGRAVLIRVDLPGGRDFDKQLPVKVDEASRPTVCAEIPHLRTLFCTTHLTSSSGVDRDEERARQVKKLHTIFAPYNARNWNIILGGDLNMRPSDPNLNSIYEPSYGGGAYGIYREAHPDRTTKAGTTDGGAPIDYIFVNDQPISISPPTITDVDYSDHHVYQATVRESLP